MKVEVSGSKWVGELKSRTANNMSIVRDAAGRDWAIPNQQVFIIPPLMVGDLVTSTLGDGERMFIVATELDRDTGEELYICRSKFSCGNRKRYAYSAGELERC